MLQDLEKGRKCEIRFIDGVVSEIEDKKRPLQDNLDAMPDLPIA